MTIDAAQLLRRLGSGATPGVELPAAAARLAEGPSFDGLLAKAQGGTLSSGVPVRVAREAGVEFTPEQFARLAEAADRAEAEGASRAVVLMDGGAFALDVGLRTITGRADLSSTRVLAGVDAVVTVAPVGGAGGSAVTSTPRGPSGAGLNKSLIELLGRDDRSAESERAA